MKTNWEAAGLFFIMLVLLVGQRIEIYLSNLSPPAPRILATVDYPFGEAEYGDGWTRALIHTRSLVCAAEMVIA